MSDVTGNTVKCPYCPHHCELSENKTGYCRSRTNRNGQSVSVNYGKVTSIALDPIEKKPLAHFYPGSKILSVGSFGCNLRCPFCQNYEISQCGEDGHYDDPSLDRLSEKSRVRQQRIPIYDVSPERLIEIAEEEKENGNIGVAFTYNEPLVSWEFVRDVSRKLHESGQKTVLVSNGCFTEDVIQEVLPFIDAMNIDLKAFSDGFYKKCGGDLETVKHFIKRAAECCHIEVTTLLIPGENDSQAEIEELSSWLSEICRDIPLHLTRFFPMYRMTDREPTDIDKMRKLGTVALKHLKHVHLGNI